MERYEIIYIVSPTLDEKDLSAIGKHIEKNITERDGKILSVQDVGKRKLAYPMNKQQYGYYTIVQFEMVPRKVKEFEKSVKIMEQMMRYMVIRYDAKTQAKMARQREKTGFVTDPQKTDEAEEVAVEQKKETVAIIEEKVVAEKKEPKPEAKAESKLTEKSSEREEKKKQMKEIDEKLDKIIDDII